MTTGRTEGIQLMAEWELAGRLAYGDYLEQRLQHVFRPEAIKLLTEAMRHYNETVINPRIGAPLDVTIRALRRAVEEAKQEPTPPPIKNRICRNDDTLEVGLWYPRIDEIKQIQIGLWDVRAADDIRIAYDFERDGWSISQAQFFEWAADSDDDDEGWQEVAFIKAWASRKEHPSMQEVIA